MVQEFIGLARVRQAIKEVRARQEWIIGNGQSISIWKDHWIGDRPICQRLTQRAKIGGVFSLN
ncbi:hypothetical protein ACHQM5_007771 [Ranunculus cassubicifolius]